MYGALQRSPSDEVLTRMADSLPEMPSVATSQEPWRESYATTGSLALSHRPRGRLAIVSSGRTPFRHVRPAFDAYTLGIGRDIEVLLPRTWKAATTFVPHEKLSGSAWVACWAPPPR